MAGHLRSSPSTTIGSGQEGRPPTKIRWRKFIEYASEWLGVEERGEWLKDMRGYLAMVATVITTITFQVGLSPPGGFVQNGEKGAVSCPKFLGNSILQACPGVSVLASKDDETYFVFLLFNSISFFSSLIVCLWLISGLPIYHRFTTWLLAIGMCISLTSLAITYLYGALMIIPDIRGKPCRLVDNSIIVWYVVVGVVGFLLVVRFVLLIVAICTTGAAIASTTPSESDQVNRGT